MMKQLSLLKVGCCAFAVLATSVAWSEDESENVNADAQAADAQTEEKAKTPENVQPLSPLTQLSRMMGSITVSDPDVGKALPGVQGKRYPAGATFEAGPNSSAVLQFSSVDSIRLAAGSAVQVLAGENPEMSRIIKLIRGQVQTFFRDNAPDGMFQVETPNAVLKNVVGKGDYTLTVAGADETFRIATITGSCLVEGPQYSIPALRAANTLSVFTAADRTLSRLFGESGEYVIVLENGTEEPLKYKMSPQAVVKIYRQHAKVGGRLIVATMVISPKETLEHRFRFAMGRPQLVRIDDVRPKDEKAAEDAEGELPVLLTPQKEEKEGEEEKKEDATE